jgi:UDP-glucose:(heptosyl)LPS alpha-1,3-glucosyltransferase
VRIALVIFRADPAHGGAERYTADVALELGKRGHAVDLIATRFGPAIEGVKFVKLRTTAATRLGKYRAFTRALRTHLKKASYDIVHAMLPVPECDIYQPHAGLARESIARKWMNRLNLKRMGFAKSEAKMLGSERKTIVLCPSDYVRRTVLEYYPDLKSRAATLFNAVDLFRFDPKKNPTARAEIRRQFKIDESQVVALMIAQDFDRKGLPQAIEALAKLGESAPLLLVVGRDDPAPYKRLARQLKVQDRVIFAGSADCPEDFYQAADFFVLPTKHDPCSLVVLESLAMGLPVISTVFNGACEIMMDGRHGFVLADPANVDKLAGAMNRLMDDKFRADARRASLALREKLSFAAHVDELEKVYLSRSAQTSTARSIE